MQEFDEKWTAYEQAYVFELMVIETDARRFVVDAIELELKLSNVEKNLKKKGLIFIQNNKEYND